MGSVTHQGCQFRQSQPRCGGKLSGGDGQCLAHMIEIVYLSGDSVKLRVYIYIRYMIMYKDCLFTYYIYDYVTMYKICKSTQFLVLPILKTKRKISRMSMSIFFPAYNLGYVETSQRYKCSKAFCCLVDPRNPYPNTQWDDCIFTFTIEINHSCIGK